MKKFISTILVVVMVFAMTSSVFAATVTVTDSAPVTNGVQPVNLALASGGASIKVYQDYTTADLDMGNSTTNQTAIQKLLDGNKTNGAFSPLQNYAIHGFDADDSVYHVINFGKKVTFNNVVFYDSRAGGFDNYIVSVSNDGTAFTEVATGTCNWQIIDDTPSNSALLQVLASFTFNQQTAQYVKVTLWNQTGNTKKVWVDGSYGEKDLTNQTPNTGKRPYAPAEIEVYNTQRYISAENLANANVYTDVKAVGSGTNAKYLYDRTNVNIVKPNVNTSNTGAPGATNFINYTELNSYSDRGEKNYRWIALDLGQERTFDTFRFVPYWNNVNAYSLYSIDKTTFDTISAAATTNYNAQTEEGNAIAPTDISSIIESKTPFHTATDIGETDVNYGVVSNPISASDYDGPRDLVVSASFSAVTGQYVLFVIDEASPLEHSSGEQYMCGIRSVEVYNWKNITADNSVNAKLTGDTVNYTANVTDNNPGSGKEIKKWVIFGEYKNNVLINADTAIFNVKEGEAITATSSYTKNDGGLVKVFTFDYPTLKPFLDVTPEI